MRVVFLALFLMVLTPFGTVAETLPVPKAGQSDSLEFARVWQAILDEAGIQAEMVAAPTGKKRQMFVDGLIQLDCCASPAWRQQADEKAVQLFSDPFYSSPEHYIFQEGKVVSIATPADLGKLRFAVVRGFSYDYQDRFGAIIPARDMEDALDMIADGRADASIINRSDYYRRMRENPRPVAIGGVHFLADLRVRVHKDRADLLPAINAAIAHLKAGGRIQAILDDLDADNVRVRAGRSDSAGFNRAWAAILEAAGITAEFVDAPQERKRRLFTEGVLQLDCCAAPIWRTRPDELESQVWSDTFYVTREQFVFRRGHEVDVGSLEALAKLRVAVVQGFDYRDQQYFGARVPGQTVEDVLKLVEAGRADVGIISNVDFYAIMREKPGPFILGPVRVEAEQKVRLHKSAAALLPRLNRAIAALKAEGKIEDALGVPHQQGR